VPLRIKHIRRKEQEGQGNPLMFQNQQRSGGIAFLDTQAISKGIELIEEAKVKAFETSEKLPRGGRKFSSSGGSTTVVRSAGEMRSGPSSFMSRQ
jgi:hypothetical protein